MSWSQSHVPHCRPCRVLPPGEFNVISSHNHVPHCRVLPPGECHWIRQVAAPGEFNDMSSQSHLSHCTVLPPGEFNVMIPEPHATLQGAAIWRIQCHDLRATCHIAVWKNSIRRIEHLCAVFYFWFAYCNLGFDRRSAAFVSSPVHLLNDAWIYLQDTVLAWQACLCHASHYRLTRAHSQ